MGSHYTLLDTAKAGRLLSQSLDGGINFLDTAACYGTSEELIGRSVSHRRHEYVLSTKCGHATAGYSGVDWSVETVRHSIERSLKRMCTDFLDIVHLHSCDLETLQRGDVIQTLREAKEAGKTRFIGYSGDNQAAQWAVNSGLFDTLETSFNLVDQWARRDLFTVAEAKSMGIIIKRPIANAAWGRSFSPSAYAFEYWMRAQAMQKLGALPDAPKDALSLAMAFTLAHSQVDTIIIGTTNPKHVAANIKLVESLQPLPAVTIEEIYRRFEKLGVTWNQQI